MAIQTNQLTKRRLHGGCGEPLVSHVIELTKQLANNTAKDKAPEQSSSSVHVHTQHNAEAQG